MKRIKIHKAYFITWLFIFYVIFANSHILFKKFDPIAAEKTYSQSQWQQSQNISPIKALDEWALKNDFTGWRNYEDEHVDQREGGQRSLSPEDYWDRPHALYGISFYIPHIA